MTAALTAIVVIVALVAALESYARWVMGLGNPPLWLSDPEIEYLPRPSQDVVRFGKRVRYNSHSMRSEEFPARKTEPGELRVLVLGDSLVNGGVQTDQEELATSLLERRLSDAMGRTVRVGNVSAGSWGPPNYLAYVRRFGLFDADVVVVVVNSTDYGDAPRFEGLGPGRPTRKPILALEELVQKYLPLLFRRVWRKRTGFVRLITESDVALCLGALREIIERSRGSGAEVLVAQHLRRSEIESEPQEGHGAIQRTCRDVGVEPEQLGPAFAEAMSSGLDPYLDDMHPNGVGQRVMAEALYPRILGALRDRVVSSADTGGVVGSAGTGQRAR